MFNYHLYGLYIARTDRSRNRIGFDDDNGGIYDVTLEQLYPLEKGKTLFYLFDYGDEWIFTISTSRKKPQEAVQGVEYPRVAEAIGRHNPEQYPIYEEIGTIYVVIRHHLLGRQKASAHFSLYFLRCR